MVSPKSSPVPGVMTVTIQRPGHPDSTCSVPQSVPSVRNIPAVLQAAAVFALVEMSKSAPALAGMAIIAAWKPVVASGSARFVRPRSVRLDGSSYKLRAIVGAIKAAGWSC